MSACLQPTRDLTIGELRRALTDRARVRLGIGPPDVGKTDGTAVTTLPGGWRSSAIVFNPADELRARTIEARRSLGPVFVFDPREAAVSFTMRHGKRKANLIQCEIFSTARIQCETTYSS